MALEESHLAERAVAEDEKGSRRSTETVLETKPPFGSNPAVHPSAPTTFVHPALRSELFQFIELKRRVAEIEVDIDERTLTDTVEGMTDLSDILIALIRSSLDDRAFAAAIRDRIETLRGRLARIDAREERKREIVREAMLAAGMVRLTDADCAVSLRAAPPSVAITDETMVPEWFWIPQPAKLDRRQLLDVVKAGTHVPGVELAAPATSLTVRVK